MMGQAAVAAVRTQYPKLLRSKFLQHGALVFAATNLANVLAYAFNFFASRALGVAHYGSLTSLVAIIAIAGLPASVATTVASKYAAELHASEGGGKVRALIERMLPFSAAVALLLFVLGAVMSSGISAFLRIDSTFDVLAVVLLVALGFPLSALRGVLTGIQNFSGFAMTIAVEAVLKFCGIGLMYAGFGVAGGIGGFIVGVVAALAVSAFVLRPYLNGPRSPLTIDLSRLARSTIGVALGMAGITLLSSMDMLLAKHYLDVTSAGYYAVVAQTGKMLFFLGAFVPTLVVPKATARAARGAPPIVVLRNAAIAAGLLLGAGLCVFYAAPKFLVTTLGGAVFAPAAPYVFWYGVAISGMVLLQITIYYKISIHRFDFVVPLVLGMLCEAAGVAHWHAGIMQIVTVLAVVNFLTLAACLYRIDSPARAAR